LAVLLN